MSFQINIPAIIIYILGCYLCFEHGRLCTNGKYPSFVYIITSIFWPGVSIFAMVSILIKKVIRK